VKEHAKEPANLGRRPNGEGGVGKVSAQTLEGRRGRNGDLEDNSRTLKAGRRGGEND